MATEVRWRRGTTAENDNFTGAEGEITVDIDKKTIRVHDGVTQGGGVVPTDEDTARLLFNEKVIPAGAFSKHKAFGITDCRPESDVIVVVYREGPDHGLSEGVIRSVRSTDGGQTWSEPQTLYSETGINALNLGGGYLENGKFVAFFETVQLSDPDEDAQLFVVTSDDDGDTWDEPELLAGPLSDRRVPYGRIVNVSDTESFQTLYADSLFIIRTTDGGETWGDVSLILDQDDAPGDSEMREPYAQKVSDGKIVMVIRDSNEEDSAPLITESTDGGETWESPIALTGVKMGTNPPALFYNESTDRLSLVWPSRGPNRMPSGGTGMFWPWYITQSLGSDAYGSDKWRAPTALNLSSPEFGSDAGDSGYQHIFEVRGRKYMTFYRGDYGGANNSGTDLFLANMDVICGWL